jgi:gamma-glutamyl phosphate reductase
MMMALSDEKREQVKALLATGAAKNDVAKKCKVSWATVDSISKENPDEIESFREHKRMQFVDRLWNSMDKALGLADKRIELALEASDKLDKLSDMIGDSDLDFKKAQELQNAITNLSTVPLGQISTFIGTMYDKHALMTGGKTGQIGVSGGLDNTNTDLTSMTPDERRARIDELNRRRGAGANSAS